MRSLVLAIVLVVTTGSARAENNGGDFGLGLQIGAPTGIVGKYYSGPIAFQFGLGVIESAWDDGTHIYADVLWHPKVLTRQRAFVMPFYVGVGGRVMEDDNNHFFHCHGGDFCHGEDFDDDLHAGVRVPFGILMDFSRVPLDVFAELAPTIDFIHDDYDDDDAFCDDGHCHGDFDDDDFVSLYVTIGARYYF